MEVGGEETELLSAATALLICYLCLHLPHMLSFSCFLIFIFILMEQIADARHCVLLKEDLIDLQK